MKINQKGNPENFPCETGYFNLLSAPQGVVGCRIHFALQNRVLDIKNCHLLVSDKEQRAVGTEMHKNDFSCLKEFRVSGD